jgi:hypothetical protein
MNLAGTTSKKLSEYASWLLTNGLIYYTLHAWVYQGATWGQWLFTIMYLTVIATNTIEWMEALHNDDNLSDDMAASIRKGTPVPLPLSFLYDLLVLYTLATTGHNQLAIGWAWQSACEIATYTRKVKEVPANNAH